MRIRRSFAIAQDDTKNRQIEHQQANYMLQNKHILIGITGGIAAYKILTLIRDFKKSGAEVKILATPNALNFVTKLTLQNLSQNEVFTNEFTPKNWKPEHISLAD